MKDRIRKITNEVLFKLLQITVIIIIIAMCFTCIYVLIDKGDFLPFIGMILVFFLTWVYNE